MNSSRPASHALIFLSALMVGLAVLLAALPARAGVMTKESLSQVFPAPYIIEDKAKDLPIWPIRKQEVTNTPVVAYAFESIDLAPIPGFAGTPFNLLIALDAKGQFMDVQVLSQHEPVFVDGLGPAPLLRFVEQYKGLSLQQNIKIGPALGRTAPTVKGANVELDGVTKATASVRIVNQTLLAAALKIARAKLGYAEGRDPDLVARIRPEVFAPLDWKGLESAGLITRKTIKNREVESAFAGTVGEGQDADAARAPEEDFIDLRFAYLSVPAVGRNLLSPADWQALQERLDPGDHALLLVGKGRYSFLGEDFVRGTVPDRLSLRQQHLPIDMRDLDFDTELKLPPDLQGAEWRIFRVIAPAGLDPAQPLEFDLHVTRSKGIVYPEKVARKFAFTASLPDRYFEAASADNKAWHSIWSGRAVEIGILMAGLAVLAWALRKQSWIAANRRRLMRFRLGYLLFTLGFIGWYAQGQLSIVNLTALVQAVIAGRSLDFFLYDPMTVLLWGFVILTLVVWGRGTFCGWLCPFGALQDLVSQASTRLGLKPRRLSERADARLKKLKYVILAAILAVACFSTAWTDRLVEVEPFKTSITLMFARQWPFVAWAVTLILLSAFVYKGYCRYLCPLGGGLALLGRLRRFDWLTRRSECGQPCQRCRNDCAYQAIHRNGGIDYQECFQCLDCVAIYNDEELCVPLIVKNRKANRGVTIPGVSVPAAETPENVA